LKNKVYLSKELNQHFRFTKDGIIFEDKVSYTNEEIELIKKSDLNIETIHTAKLKFDATILSEDELDKLTIEYNKGPSNFQQAVDQASKLIKEGMKGNEAVHRASNNYNVSSSAIGQELGKRRKK